MDAPESAAQAPSVDIPTSAAVNTATGKAIRVAIRRSGLQYGEVADAAGMSRSSLSRKMSGKRAANVPDLVKIARVIDVDPVVLLRDPEVA